MTLPYLTFRGLIWDSPSNFRQFVRGTFATFLGGKLTPPYTIPNIERLPDTALRSAVEGPYGDHQNPESFGVLYELQMRIIIEYVLYHTQVRYLRSIALLGCSESLERAPIICRVLARNRSDAAAHRANTFDIIFNRKVKPHWNSSVSIKFERKIAVSNDTNETHTHTHTRARARARGLQLHFVQSTKVT